MKRRFKRWVHGVGPLRLALATLHLGVAAVTVPRPHMVEIIGGYSGFAAIADTQVWGIMAGIIGTGLLVIPRGQPWLILWQFASAAFFLLFALLVTIGPAGLNWGTAAYGLPGVWSILLVYTTADEWFKDTQWPQRFRAWLGRGEQRGRP